MNNNCNQRLSPRVYNCYVCGPTGPTGPTGPQGPATITVGTTTTGAPGTDASVTNVGTSENVILDFVIPEGEIGPTGPTGPAALNSILVGNDGTQTVPSRELINLGALINQTGASLSHTTPNTITFEVPGTYLINVSTIINNSEGAAGDLGISMNINGTVVPTSSEYIATQTAAFSSELQHNYNAAAGDTLTLTNESTVSNDYHDVTVSVLRIV